nr:ABC transporter permease subunit [Tissierella sp.]
MSDNKINNDKDKKPKKSSFSLLFSNLFGKKEELSYLQEEEVQSPLMTVIKTFMENKVAMTGLIVFSAIFLTVLIGPLFKPIDLSYSETSQKDTAPGMDMMKYPEALDGNVADIAIGPSFSVGLSKDGDIYAWGKTKITDTIDIKNLPVDRRSKKPIEMGKLVDVAAGFDHIVALNEAGEVFAWGSDRQKQASIPLDLQNVTDIKEVYAGYQASMALGEDGKSYFFGNNMNNDYNEFHQYQGQLKKLALTADAVMGLTNDGKVVYLGSQQNSYARVPEDMGTIVDIAATASTMAAVNDKGEVKVWGNVSRKGEGSVPETDSKIVSLDAGRYHYVAITEDSNIVSWGNNSYKKNGKLMPNKQTDIPSNIQNGNTERVYTGYYQNYAINKSGKINTWGLKGYSFGTDELGRDVFTRLLNGGRMSMTIGAVAVIISTIIGIVIGSLSGYFGGKLDNVLQRFSEIIAALPFLPFAMILSALIGNNMGSKQKTILIMVILGLLSWTGLQRLVRAQVLSVREQEYVVAAKAVGIKERNIVFKHILPNVISVIIVSATLSFATSMLTEASLSYLGFGVQAPQPTWGNMLYGANNSTVIQYYWWRWVFASALLGTCVICINLIGDGLRDAIDPKSQER